jgi:hypothetical protein
VVIEAASYSRFSDNDQPRGTDQLPERVARPRRPAAQAVGISLAELEAPFSDYFVSKDDAATGHQLFDIAEAQREAKVEPNAMTNYFGVVAMATVSWDRSVHQRIMRMNTHLAPFAG